jgi:hypothetical protein
MTTTFAEPETILRTGRSRFTWLTVLVAVLALALGFGAGFLTSQTTQDEPIGLADDATVSLIEDNMAAFNAGDANALAATTTSDVVFTVVSSEGIDAQFKGPESVMANIGQTSGLKATSEFVRQGPLVTSTYSEASSTGVQIYKIAGDKIAHVWILLG